MKKIIAHTKLKNITRAIIIFQDPMTGQHRRVIFGDPEDALELFVVNAELVARRLQNIVHQKFETAKQMKKAVDKTRPFWVTDNGTYVGSEDKKPKLRLEYKLEVEE